MPTHIVSFLVLSSVSQAEDPGFLTPLGNDSGTNRLPEFSSSMNRLNSFCVCASCFPFTMLRKVYQMESGFSRFWMVDRDSSRWFCQFHLNGCANFTQFISFTAVQHFCLTKA